MLQAQSIVKITDNTGGKIGRVFKVIGSAKKRYAGIGELVVLSVQVAEPRKAIKKKDVLTALVVRTKNAMRRKDGSYIRFDDNAVVIVDKNKKELKGTRIFGPIPREVVEAGYNKIGSLAPEVV